MITVVQRVLRASVAVDGAVVGAIGAGLLLLVGVERGDGEADADETARKVAALRCFPGRTPMDRTALECGGSCLLVSQFTLAAELAQGNRPSFTDAEAPARAEALYLRLGDRLAAAGVETALGRFGAHMVVESANDGPVTLLLTVRRGRTLPRPTPDPS